MHEIGLYIRELSRLGGGCKPHRPHWLMTEHLVAPHFTLSSVHCAHYLLFYLLRLIALKKMLHCNGRPFCYVSVLCN